MQNKDFKIFITMIDQAYPKQQKLNKVQQGFFWLSLKDHTIEDCVQSLSCHTHTGEWKPQICDIVKHLPNETLPLVEMFSNFFNRKEVKDKIALECYRIMGGDKLNKTLEKDYYKLEQKFINLYRQQATKKRLEELPNKLKQKLIRSE
tara:strand:+ start:2742 stop:3185 length:444 start_codon:yes stop_codon:yes gene_type:complete